MKNKKNILILDDNSENSVLIEKSLQEETYIFELLSQKSELNRLYDRRHHLVMINLSMKFSNPFKILKKLKSKSHNKDTPVICFENNYQHSHRKKIYSLGANDYLPGPFIQEELKRKILQFTELSVKNENEIRLNLAIEASHIGIWDWDIQNNQLLWDGAMYDLFEVAPSEFSGTVEAWEKTLHPDDLMHAKEELEDALQNKKHFNTGFRILTKNRNIKHIHAVAKVFFDNEGNAVRMVGVNTDVSEVKETLQKLKKSEVRLNEAQKLAQIGSWELDSSTNDIYWSDEVYRIFEVDPKNFKASYDSFFEAVHPEDREKVNQAYQKHLETKELYSVQHRILLKNGKIKYVFERGNSEFDQNGNPVKSIGTVQDVTEIEKTMDIIRETENKYKQIIDTAQEGFVIADGNNLNILEVNQSYCDIHGYDSRELLNMKITDIILAPAKDLEFMAQSIKKNKNSNFEIQSSKKDGSIIEVQANVHYSAERNEYFAFIQDITEKKADKEEIIKLNQNLEEIIKQRTKRISILTQALEQNPSSVMISSKEGEIIYVNQTFLKTTGYTYGEVLGAQPSFLKSDKMSQEIYDRLWDTILDGKIWKGELLNKKKNGEHYWVFTSISPIYDENNDISDFISVQEDITEQKKAQKKLEETNRELKTQRAELQEFNKILIDREMRNIELKKEINALAKELGKKFPYAPVWEDDNDER